MRTLMFLLGFMACVLPAPDDGAEIQDQFFVSTTGSDDAPGTQDGPFRTLGRAVDALAEALPTLPGAAEVYIEEGEYAITEPLRFGPEHSGRRSPRGDSAIEVVFQPMPGKKVLISGGTRLGGWEAGEAGIWRTRVPEDIAAQWESIELYVDGERRRRARTPNEGFYIVAGFPDGGLEVGYHTDCDEFEFAPGDIRADWTNLEDVEVIVYHFWTDSHLPIESIDTEKNIVKFEHKAGKVFTDDFTSDGARYIVENVFEALDAPGEWYFNRKTRWLHYIPMPGEDMAEAECIVPLAPALVEFKGDPLARDYVRDITFRGIDFRYTDFRLPEGNSNDRQGSASVPAAVTLEGARNIVFEDCTFSNLGTFAFEVGAGCADNAFRRNTIANVGGGGFRVNGGDEGEHPLLRTRNTEIVDNVIGPYGDLYPSAVGVLLMQTEGNRVAHNEIHHGWYTGVSVGWEWGYQRSISRDNIVEFNHIHHIGQGLLSDMGGIYTLGVSPGTVLRNNFIHDVEANRYGGWGIYNDEGSTHILIEDNVVHDTKFAGYNIHYAKEITVRNNIFAFGRLEQVSRTRAEPHESCYFEGNIVYFTEGELFSKNWKDKPYTFHFHPKNAEGTRETTTTFRADYNLYYNPGKSVEEVDFNGMTFEEWREAGKDRHSVYADPMFKNPDTRDFTLREGSPAFALGFRPIDLSEVGPRR